MAYDTLYTIDDLKTMQSWDLDRKILVTQTRIMEWYMRFKGQVYVSFSGGKDSTVLLDLVRRIYPDVPAVYCDTGLEYPEIKEFVKTFENVTIVRPEKSFRQVIREHGYPVASKEISRKINYAKKGATWAKKYIDGSATDSEGRPSRYRISNRWLKLLNAPFEVSDYCCYVMKKRPLHRYEKESGRKPIIATMAMESNIRTHAWMRTGCNAFDGAKQRSNPMSFWTEQDVLSYIKRFDIPYCSVYGEIALENAHSDKLTTSGCKRTGCIFCMFGCHLDKTPNRFQQLKETHPKIWEYCLKPISDGGLGLKEVLDYIDVPYE